MHVGHLRTTVVGDALVRTLEHLGHHVIRQNHVGDWGTPFGMLIEHLLVVGEDSPEAQLLVTDPNAFYAAANAEFEGDAEFATRARTRVVSPPGRRRRHPAPLGRAGRPVQAVLQPRSTRPSASRSPTTTWPASRRTTTSSPSICDELEAQGIATVSDGALCVFLDGYTGREGKPVSR